MPTTNQDHITLFGRSEYRGKSQTFGIKRDDRRRHMYIIGKTGMGKTTMMEQMAVQDICHGHGLCFLDPHGDSVNRLLDFIPANRINDVIFFNPSDLNHPLALNVLETTDQKSQHLVVEGLMSVFTKIWANMWSARMEYILSNTVRALLDTPGNTLLGISRMYVDDRYRRQIVRNIRDPMVKIFWAEEFANYDQKYVREAVAPIQNKVGQFLASRLIRNIVGQTKSTIDLRRIMDERKILLVDLSKGRVGEENASLLGGLLVTKLQLAALSRADIPEEDRQDFYLYVDEFQNFATESFASILSEARKYRLCLVMGHQYIGQLATTSLRDAIFGNVGTIACFRLGAADAEYLATELAPTYDPQDIVNLSKYSFILRLMIDGVAGSPFSANTIPPTSYRTGHREKVIRLSRERYSRPLALVESRITRWLGSIYITRRQ